MIKREVCRSSARFFGQASGSSAIMIVHFSCCIVRVFYIMVFFKCEMCVIGASNERLIDVVIAVVIAVRRSSVRFVRQVCGFLVKGGVLLRF